MFHLFVIDAWGWIVLTNSTVVIEKAKQNKRRGKRGTEVMIIFMARNQVWNGPESHPYTLYYYIVYNA